MRDKSPASVLQPYLGLAPSRFTGMPVPCPKHKDWRSCSCLSEGCFSGGRRICAPLLPVSCHYNYSNGESSIKNKSHGTILHWSVLHERLFISVYDWLQHMEVSRNCLTHETWRLTENKVFEQILNIMHNLQHFWSVLTPIFRTMTRILKFNFNGTKWWHEKDT